MAQQEKKFLQQMIDGFSSVVESAAALAKRVGWPLDQRTHARVPLDWAKSTGNQGVALM